MANRAEIFEFGVGKHSILDFRIWIADFIYSLFSRALSFYLRDASPASAALSLTPETRLLLYALFRAPCALSLKPHIFCILPYTITIER